MHCRALGGVEEALVSASSSPTKSHARRVHKQPRLISEVPRRRGRSGSSSNCKVKPTPPHNRVTLRVSPFTGSLILFRKNTESTMSLTLRPFSARFPLYTLFTKAKACNLHVVWSTSVGWVAFHKRIEKARWNYKFKSFEILMNVVGKRK